MAPDMKKSAKSRGRTRQSAAVEVDLQWCYDRLSHLLYIWENPASEPALFEFEETMATLAAELPKIRSVHKLADRYHHR